MLLSAVGTAVEGDGWQEVQEEEEAAVSLRKTFSHLSKEGSEVLEESYEN